MKNSNLLLTAILLFSISLSSIAQVATSRRKKKTNIDQLYKRAIENQKQEEAKKNNTSIYRGGNGDKKNNSVSEDNRKNKNSLKGNFAKIPYGKYYIQSAMNFKRDNYGYWDLPGYNKYPRNGSNLATYRKDGGKDQTFYITTDSRGYYQIKSALNSRYVLDLDHNRKNNGTNFTFYERNNSNAQKFYFEHLGNGRFKIHHKSGKIVTLANRSSANGSNIHLWNDHNGIWNEWYLIDSRTHRKVVPNKKNKIKDASIRGTKMKSHKRYYIQSAMNYGRDKLGCWDVPGRNQRNLKGKNLQIWKLDNGADRFFNFRLDKKTGYYTIEPTTFGNYAIDVAGGKRKNGTNVCIWNKHNGNNQKFYFKHLGNGRFKIYTQSGKIICPKGRRNDNGTNVHIWNDHNGIWCEWYIVDKYTGKAFIPKKRNRRRSVFY